MLLLAYNQHQDRLKRDACEMSEKKDDKIRWEKFRRGVMEEINKNINMTNTFF